MEKKDTLIGKDTDIKGLIVSVGDILIRGTVEGEIMSKGKVEVAGDALVKGNIYAGSVVLRGRVDGKVYTRKTMDSVKALEKKHSGREALKVRLSGEIVEAWKKSLKETKSH